MRCFIDEKWYTGRVKALGLKSWTKKCEAELSAIIKSRRIQGLINQEPSIIFEREPSEVQFPTQKSSLKQVVSNSPLEITATDQVGLCHVFFVL